MKLRSSHKILLSVLAAVLLLLIVSGIIAAQAGKNSIAQERTVYIPTGADYQELLDSLGADGIYIKDKMLFDKVARVFSLNDGVRPGLYTLRPGMSYIQSVKMFRNGIQTPVKLTFNNIRTIPQLAGKLAQQIEADSGAIMSLLGSEQTPASYGFTPESFIGMFIPNTYEVWWTTSPEALMDRMKKEYDRFWNAERTARLEQTGLDREQAVTLASIVYEESKMSDEMPMVAGVYMNRLAKGMLLQADPTVKYAVGDFTLRRILHMHLEVDSPYNTYKYAGLPPGPICMPSVKAIDAVLDPKKHNYLFFCAKPDFSGYHNFAVTLAEHSRNAREYYNALNMAGIK